ncbi:MAG: sigma 54-interacting transcriptional regulator [Clostridiales Family XIII bacterium]|jgi:transcriptional regulator of acetoin/glycerol metabolism|nr:sigma 54-interacting transcriptional regulator [Clostridiales Family XIII bacterium]
MRNPQYINYVNDPQSYMKNVHEEWKKFIEGGITNGLAVRDEVLDSWKQSLKNGLPCAGTGAALVLDEKMIAKINRKNTLLLDAATPVIDEFADMLGKRDATNCVINLCNEDTVILRTVACDAEGEKNAISQNILPGAILDEKHTGTTGVSLARTTNSPYALYGPEHFRQSARICNCAAAPITNVRTKQLKGIIALSGEDFDIVPDTIGTVTFIARTIESNLLLSYVQREELLVGRFKEMIKRGGADLVLAVDADLNIIASSLGAHPIVRSVLSVRKLEKSVFHIAEKAGEKYLYGRHSDGADAILTEGTEDYHIEFHPVYREEAYIGMILLVRDLREGLCAGQASDVPGKQAKTIMVGRNPAFRAALDMAVRIAHTDVPVMMQGETGAGKEGFARTIYERSNRADKPYIAINCGALPGELIGSELFGYVPGAFTGASQKGNAGKFEAANGGTIFLDELGALPLDAQSYLLRVVEENELYRLGSTRSIPIDVRLICATNENLLDLVNAKLFRADLYYRLNVVEINIPPLRDRMDDFPELISLFCAKYAGDPCVVADADVAFFSQYRWPGNVRELKNVLHGASVLGVNVVEYLRNYVRIHIKADKDGDHGDFQMPPAGTDDDLERIVEACGGNIAKAARQLGVARSTIYRRMQRNP